MLIGDADHGAFEDPGKHVDHLLDLVREHLEARHDDHVLLAVDDADEAFLVHDADVAGMQEKGFIRSEEHTSELQSQSNLVCRLLLEKKKKKKKQLERKQ